jgi:TPR repeat protein
MYNLAMVYVRAADWEQAEHWFRQGAGTGDTGAMEKLAQVLEQRGRHDEAARWFRRARSRPASGLTALDRISVGVVE